MAESSETATGIARWVPIVGWLPRYQRAWFGSDLIAGFTIWGLLIPEMIAYASLAGLSPQAGLYTLLASLGLYAIFGTSRQLVVAGTSASAVLVFAAVTDLSPQTTSSFPALAAGLIMLTGFFLMVAGLARLGFITQFLSRPVMAGFVFGLAIFVTVSQLPKLLGIEQGTGDTIRQLAHLVANLDTTSLTTLAVGAAALAVLFGMERLTPRYPGGLVVLVLGIGISNTFNLSEHGVAVIGAIPTGLPSPSLPHLQLEDLWVLLPIALGMMLVIYSEALAAATAFADQHRYRIEPNQELIALGIANLASGVLGGLASGGSLSQSAVNDRAGARSEMSPIVAALLSLITVIALTPLFHDLPDAVLAALIIHAVSHLMHVAEMREFYRLRPAEFWLAMLTLLSVVVFDVLPALIIGVAVSLVLLLSRSSRPKVSVLGANPEAPGAYDDVDRHPESKTVEGVLIVRPDASLFYANAQSVRDAIETQVRRRATTNPVKTVVLDVDANDELDITSAQQLLKLATHLQPPRCAAVPRRPAHAGAPDGAEDRVHRPDRCRPRLPDNRGGRCVGEPPIGHRAAVDYNYGGASPNVPQMADETPTADAGTPDAGAPEAAPDTGAPPKKRSIWIPIVIVVALVVIAGAGLAIYKSKNSDSTAAPPARKAAFGLFRAWKNANQAAAAKNANPVSVQSLFVLNPSEAQGLAFRGCNKAGGSGQKTCVWKRTNGKIAMTVITVNGKPKVSAVKITPDPATSSSSTSSTTVPPSGTTDTSTT